jgi:hypothetical protein
VATCRACLAVLLVVLPGAALAQPLSSFDQLGQRLNAGDRIRIVDWSGHVITGRVAGLAAEEIALARGAGTTEAVARADVREVSFRRPDSIRNGVLIGFTVGAVGYCSMAIAYSEPEACVVGGPLIGGLGATAGALVDLLIRRRVVVFRATQSPVAVSVWVAAGGVHAGLSRRW